MNINLESKTTIYSVELENKIVDVEIYDNFVTGVVDVQLWVSGKRLGEHDVVDGVLVKDIKNTVCDMHFGDAVK
jgi:hypothetical protein